MTAAERAHVARVNRELRRLRRRAWRDEVSIVLGQATACLLVVACIARALWIFGGGS